MGDRPSEALTEGILLGELRTYDAISKRRNVPLSTLHHRSYRRRLKEEKAQSQQYLTPSEEKALEKFLKLMSDPGNPMRIKFLPRYFMRTFQLPHKIPAERRKKSLAFRFFPSYHFPLSNSSYLSPTFLIRDLHLITIPSTPNQDTRLPAMPYRPRQHDTHDD